MSDRIVFNYFCNGLMEIPSGNEPCPRCKGLGHTDEDFDDDELNLEPFECWVCGGCGYLDWVKKARLGSWKDKNETIVKNLKVLKGKA